jgi:hypothetical protein
MAGHRAEELRRSGSEHFAMKDQARGRARVRGPQFDHLEGRAMMSHVSAAVVEADLARLGHATPAQTTSGNGTGAGQTNNAQGGGRNLGPEANPGGFKSIQNAYSPTDVYTNYIGGPIGITAFVDGLYADILHRFPTTQESGYWAGTLESGRYTPYTVVSEFLTSPEGIADGSGGQALRPSHPPTNVYTSYLGGNIGVTAFVDGLYFDVLQRQVDPVGEAYWVDQIEQHELLPAKVTFGFLASSEYAYDVAHYGTSATTAAP